MCTVTFVPDSSSGFTLSSSRDELSTRGGVKFPTTVFSKEHELLIPQDVKGGGTWLAAESSTRVICLLNGAWENHERVLPYRHSRGKVVLESFEYIDAATFTESYNFDNLEPFTLVWVEFNAGISLFEIRWDGVEISLKEMDSGHKHLWSSATLYDAPSRAKRQLWFQQWWSENESSSQTARQFHYAGGEQDSFNGIVMSREGNLKTVSISSVSMNHNETKFVYHALDPKSDPIVAIRKHEPDLKNN